MKFISQKNKRLLENEMQMDVWSEISKEKQFQPNSKWTINCLKVTHNYIYFFILFLLNLLLLLQIYRCFDLFKRGHTYIETKVVPQTKVLFPAVTICPGTNGYKIDVLQVVFINRIIVIK